MERDHLKTDGSPLLPDDRTLAKGMLRGDEAAFDAFFDRHFPGLFRFALARLGQNPDAAQEAVQSAMAKAIRKLDTFRGEATLFTWLCTFCRHEIAAHWRSRAAAPAPIEDTPEIRAALETLALEQNDDPEKRLRRRELARLVQVTLDYLPKHYGDALEWKYIEGVSVAEIGTRLRIAPKAAESLLTRAREAFRDGFHSLDKEGCLAPR